MEVVLDTADIMVGAQSILAVLWSDHSLLPQAFGRATANLKFESFDGGRDSRERMTQVMSLGSGCGCTHIYSICVEGWLP